MTDEKEQQKEAATIRRNYKDFLSGKFTKEPPTTKKMIIKECEAPIPRYYGWVFKNNGVQTGCITAQNVFSKKELKFAKEYLKWMGRGKKQLNWPGGSEPFSILSTRGQNLGKVDKNAIDWTALWNRLKVFINFRYEYPKRRINTNDKKPKWNLTLQRNTFLSLNGYR